MRSLSGNLLPLALALMLALLGVMALPHIVAAAPSPLANHLAARNDTPPPPEEPTNCPDSDSHEEAEPPCAVVAGVSRFRALPRTDHVAITWETEAEHQNIGFNLYRGTNTEAPTAPLNPTLIPSQSASGEGGSYHWADYEAVRGTSYYYWLEDMDAAGTLTLHGPVVVLHQAPTAVTLSDLTSAPPPPSPWGLLALLGALLIATGHHWRGR